MPREPVATAEPHPSYQHLLSPTRRRGYRAGRHMVMAHGSGEGGRNALYELDLSPGTGRAWALATVPRQFDGKGRQRRLGSDLSCWQADPEQQQANWYAHAATEILIVGTTADTQLSYAVAAARLCDHTIVWDSRTPYPVPLHGASRMPMTYTACRDPNAGWWNCLTAACGSPPVLRFPRRFRA